MTIQHWLLILAAWSHPDRSLVKAAAVVRANLALLLAALAGLLEVGAALRWIQRLIETTCHMNTRKQKPNAYQLLLALDQGGSA